VSVVWVDETIPERMPWASWQDKLTGGVVLDAGMGRDGLGPV
jgi:hypothetical protein